MSSTIKVAVATPLEPGLRRLVTDVDPSVDLLVDDALLPPQRVRATTKAILHSAAHPGSRARSTGC